MKTIGKYEICGLLGRGGMSVVYKARIPVVKKIVALKLLAPHPHLLSLLGEEEIERRFIAEAVTMAALRHPNVVQVLDFDRARGRPFFTMEYYCRSLGTTLGESFRTEAPSRLLSLDKAIYYVRQTLQGLSRFHRSGMVHRDIKPHNLLITDEDELKISDFGLSKLRRETSNNPSNLMVGSPYYAAPEQERDPDGADRRADLYSVGVILYRMLTGQLPGEGSPRPSECHPDTSSPWDNFVFKAIAQDREDRFPDAETMLGALDTLKEMWEERKRNLCRLPPTLPSHPRGKPPIKPLRHIPVKTDPSRSISIFDSDALWRPLHYIENDLHLLDTRAVVVLDRATHLIWQRAGSEDPLEWHEAHAYVHRLNTELFGGRSVWRLPTVNELFSLLKPVTLDRDECIEGLLGHTDKCLWSADRRSFAAAWYVNGELGFAGWGDFTCRYFVRAVCSSDQ